MLEESSIFGDGEDQSRTGNDLSYIFVYGSLKKGFFSHRYVRDQEFIGEFETKPNYKLYELENGLPVLVETKDGVSVKGEIYRVDRNRLDLLDMYERGAGYDRFTIQIEGWDDKSPVLSYLYAMPFVAKKDWHSEWNPNGSRLKL